MQKFSLVTIVRPIASSIFLLLCEMHKSTFSNIRLIIRATPRVLELLVYEALSY